MARMTNSRIYFTEIEGCKPSTFDHMLPGSASYLPWTTLIFPPFFFLGPVRPLPPLLSCHGQVHTVLVAVASSKALPTSVAATAASPRRPSLVPAAGVRPLPAPLPRLSPREALRPPLPRMRVQAPAKSKAARVKVRVEVAAREA